MFQKEKKGNVVIGIGGSSEEEEYS